jgi:hypothetical protein
MKVASMLKLVSEPASAKTMAASASRLARFVPDGTAA